MANDQNGSNGARPEAEFAEALKELQRGERTAKALEDHLDNLEKKIEELLAQAEKNETDIKTAPKPSGEMSSEEKGKKSP